MAGDGTIRVDVNLKALKRQAGEFVEQIPFAISRGLNTLAFAARAEVVKQLPHDFIIRAKWEEKGIRVGTANKRDLSAMVGSVRDEMVGQATGAKPEGMTPMVGKGRPRPTKKSKTPPSRWPGASKWGDKFMGIPANSAGGKAALVFGLWQRVTKRGKGPKSKRKGLRLLYVLNSRSPEQRGKNNKWPLPQHVLKVLKSSATDKAFEEALSYAIATAKKKK